MLQWYEDTSQIYKEFSILSSRPRRSETELFQRVIREHCKPGEASILHKIDIIGHLELSDQEKQRVDKAFQLLSRRMSIAFKLSGLEDQGEIISCINDFFDVLNSRKTHTFNPLKCAFGRNLQVQVKAIQNMKELLEGPKVNPCPKRKRNAQMPFRKGLLIDIQSILHRTPTGQNERSNKIYSSKDLSVTWLHTSTSYQG